MNTTTRPIGDILREWRQRRRLSQLDLACEADISTRHLSFVETGRSQPSRDMVLHLADRLDIPLRERNTMLIAAGFAPLYPERPLDAPPLAAIRQAVDQVLAGHEPYPALAIDRHWTLVAANRAVLALLDGVDPSLREPPVNVMRLALHPKGLAPRTANLAEWRGHLLHRLRRQRDVSADPVIGALVDELEAYPKPPGGPTATHADDPAQVAVPFRLTSPGGPLAFFSTTMVFGTAMDITLSELAIEAFFPADAETAARLRGLVAA
jgi:transcriptional regulator with XRE-family HTH domain